MGNTFMSNLSYVIGLDFGTDSVRALLVDALTGEEISTSVSSYKRWANGLYCNPSLSQYRQHPSDYIESMEDCIKEILNSIPREARGLIKGISLATTGSTPAPVDENGIPLALLPEHSENPNAMFILWKDHTAVKEADEINQLASVWPVDYTKYSGGIYSPEWFWSKILHIVRKDEKVKRAAFSWLEHCDWIPATLTGNTDPLKIKRSRCAAGHKAMWHQEFNGLPSEEFLTTLDSKLKGLRQNLYSECYTTDEVAGMISPEWAKRLRLPDTVVIGVGAIDAHAAAVGAGIEPYSMVKVMGTSTCDMVVVPLEDSQNQLIKGICGQVNGSVLPEMLGMEAGQSAFGDMFSWFRDLVTSPLKEVLSNKLSQSEWDEIFDNILPMLGQKASELPVLNSDELAIDWINGRRTPDMDMSLNAAITRINLGSDAVRIFKSLVESTAFGSKAIIERFIDEGIPINSIIAVGGISKKSDFVMNTLANILNIPIKVISSDQAGALGSCMFAATISGIYHNISAAQRSMSSEISNVYIPDKEKAKTYKLIYKEYLNLGTKLSNKT
jgi:L-ribulokinase